MEKDIWGVSIGRIRNIKTAYKKLYLESRELDVPVEYQDSALEQAVETKFMESLKKALEQNSKTSEKKSLEFFNELKVYMAQWKKEFDEGIDSDDSIKEIVLKKTWWQFWK